MLGESPLKEKFRYFRTWGFSIKIIIDFFLCSEGKGSKRSCQRAIRWPASSLRGRWWRNPACIEMLAALKNASVVLATTQIEDFFKYSNSRNLTHLRRDFKIKFYGWGEETQWPTSSATPGCSPGWDTRPANAPVWGTWQSPQYCTGLDTPPKTR